MDLPYSFLLGKSPLKRIPEVFDCWFESGSMPYAQLHYPFEHMKEFEEYFPADFIAEGIDQTRGWFYTLIVISTALFGKAPFKNLIANGLILASDGQKMSKSKRNYPDPLGVVNKYGADALRLYLINSPVVRAENLRFKEEGVRDVVKDVFLPWYNAFRFLLQNIEIYVQTNNTSFFYDEQKVNNSTNIMDKWILSFTQSLLSYVHKEMNLYHLYNVIPRLTKFFDYLTNWYVRMNRKRLKGENGLTDCESALTTLFNVLINIIKMMSPFAPFLSETMYQYLKQLTFSSGDSVHYLMLPKPNESLIDINIERAVSRMQSVIELGRVVRDRKTIPIKYPLPEIIIIHQDPQYLDDIISLQEYVLLELNVRKISITTDKSKFGITLRAEPDFKILGVRLKQDFKSVVESLKSLTDFEINEMAKQGYREIAGQRIELSEVRLIFQSASLNTDRYEVHSDNDVLILLDITPDSSMQDEGMAREIINRVQKLRKKAHLVPTDQICVFYQAGGDLQRVAQEYTEFIEGTLKTTFRDIGEKIDLEIIIEEKQKLKDHDLVICLTKTTTAILPVNRWVNVQLIDLKSRYCNDATKGIILLEYWDRLITVEQLRKFVFNLFGVETFDVWTKNEKIIENKQLNELCGDTLFITPIDKKPTFPETTRIPFCKISNLNESQTIIHENPLGHPTSGRLPMYV